MRRATYSVRDRTAHARNHNNTTPIAKPNHLLCGRLRRHKSACNINLKHGVRVLCRIFQCRRLLLDASGGDKAIQTTVLGGNLLDDGIEMLYLADVNATVVQFRVELRDGALLDASEVFARFGWGDGLDGRTGYGEGNSHKVCLMRILRRMLVVMSCGDAGREGSYLWYQLQAEPQPV